MPPITKLVETRCTDVWILDDTESFCFILSAFLNSTHSVRCSRCFYRCEHALRALKQGAEPPDAILLDIKFPSMSGLEAVPLLQILCPHAHIIILTSFNTDENVARALAQGASGYLIKGMHGDQIVRGIEAALQGGMPLDPIVARRLVELSGFRMPSHSSYDFTPREIEVMQVLMSKPDLTNQQAAEVLYMSLGTFLTHTEHIHAKLQVRTRAGMIVRCLKERLV